MIYFLHGTDTKKAREKLHTLLDSLRAKKPDAAFFKITEDNFENVSSDIKLDEDTGKKSYYINGIFMQAEQQNRNGRIYPAHILEREVQKYTKEYINTSQALGEVEHPQSASINLERVSHLTESLTRSGNNWIGKAKVLNTPMGNLVKGLLEDGVQIGVSTRGLGTLREEDGISYVNEDYVLNTIDIVSSPSAPQAFVNGILEGKEFYVNDNQEFIEKVKIHMDKEASKTSFSMVEEKVLMNVFESFINKI